MSIFILIIAASAVSALLLLYGGAFPYLSIPAYGLVATAGLLSFLCPRNSQPRNLNWGGLLASILFFGYIQVRALTSPAPYIARADLYMVLAAVIIYLLFTLALTSSRMRVQFVTVILVIAAANFVIGGIQFFKGHNFMPFSFLPRSHYGARASGFFGCPNHLAGFLEVAMLFGLSLASWSRYSLLLRITAGYTSAMCAAGILLTGSRGGYASSIVGLAMFGFISLLLAGKWLRREFWYSLLACTILAAVALGFAVRSAVRESEFLQYRVESVNLDVGVRASLARAALQQFHLSPWFGTGSRTYLFFGRQFRGPQVLADPTFAHNDYAQLLGEYGVVGFGGFCLFLAFHMKSGWNSLAAAATANAPVERQKQAMKRSEKGSRSRSAWRAVEDEDAKRLEQHRPAFKGSNSLALTAASLSSVSAYMVHSFVDFNLHIPANACLMAFVFAILANPGTTATNSQTQHREAGTKWIAILQRAPAALGLWLMIAALPTWPGEYYGERARRLLSDWHLLDSPEIATEAGVFSRKGLEHDSKNPELYYYLGESQVTLAMQAAEPAERIRLYEDSVSAYQSALRLAPRDVRYVLCLAWSLDALEHFDEAESAFVLALQLDPNSVNVHSSYAAHFHQQKKLEQAEVEYAIALKLGHTNIEYDRLQLIRKEIDAKKAQAGTPAAPAK